MIRNRKVRNLEKDQSAKTGTIVKEKQLCEAIILSDDEIDFEYNKNDKSPNEEIDNHTMYSVLNEETKKSEYKKDGTMKNSASTHSLLS